MISKRRCLNVWNYISDITNVLKICVLCASFIFDFNLLSLCVCLLCVACIHGMAHVWRPGGFMELVLLFVPLHEFQVMVPVSPASVFSQSQLTGPQFLLLLTNNNKMYWWVTVVCFWYIPTLHTDLLNIYFPLWWEQSKSSSLTVLNQMTQGAQCVSPCGRTPGLVPPSWLWICLSWHIPSCLLATVVFSLQAECPVLCPPGASTVECCLHFDREEMLDITSLLYNK